MKVAPLFALVACGSPPALTPPEDAPPVADVAVDLDAPDEAARVDVLVRKLDFTGDPDTTAIVIFYDAADNVVSHGPVDAAGRAHAYLPDGGAITTVRRTEIGGQDFVGLITMRGVKPGDDLTFGRRIQKHRLESGAVDVMVATYTPFDNSTLGIAKACGGAGLMGGPGSPFVLTFFEDCTTPTFDMFVLSFGTPRAFVWMPDIPYVGGGGITVPDAWQVMGTQTTRFDHLPAGTTQLAVNVDVVVGPTLLSMNTGQFDLSPGAATVDSAWPTGAGRGSFVRARRMQGFDELEQHAVFEPAAPSVLAVDLAALPLPRFPQRATQSRTGVTWTETGTPGGDARYVDWAARYIDGDSQEHFFNWVTIEDPLDGATSSPLLALPDAYADRDPTRVLAVVLTLTGAHVMYVDYDAIGGYDEARPNAVLISDFESTYLDGVRHAHRTRSP